jgi:hypothetical protein
VFAAKDLQFICGIYKFSLKALVDCPFLSKSHTLEVLFRPQYPKQFNVHKDLPPWVQAVFDNIDGFKSSLDQDVIYALQNVVEGERHSRDRLLSSIDYSKSTSDVFQEWAKSIINTTGILWPLNVFEDRSMSRANDLPTWIPDLRKLKYRMLLRHDYDEKEFAKRQDLKDIGVLKLLGRRLAVSSKYRTLRQHKGDLSLVRNGLNGNPFHVTEHCCPEDVDNSKYGRFSTKMRLHPPIPGVASPTPLPDGSYDRSDYIFNRLESLDYKLCDIEMSKEALRLKYDNILVIPAAVTPKDIIVLHENEPLKRHQLFAYALRPLSGRYCFLGPCISCHDSHRKTKELGLKAEKWLAAQEPWAYGTLEEYCVV